MSGLLGHALLLLVIPSGSPGLRSPIFAQSTAATSHESVVLSVVALAVALIALLINLGGLVRRPKITADWGVVEDGGGTSAPQEGLWIIVTARRRPIQVSEVGILLLPKKTLRRQLGRWQLRPDNHFRRPLGNIETTTLTDGETLETGMELDHAVEEFRGRAGVDYCYVMASGKVYFVRPDSKLRRWLSGQKSG